MIDLDNRVVLVTGAAGAIGSATARTVVNTGGRVVIHDRPGAPLDALADELGDRARAITVDLADPVSAADLWNRAASAFGRVDLLVINAGIYPPAPIVDPLDDWLAVWDTSLAVNLISPAVLCRAAVRAFSDQEGGGVIVNLASRAAFRGEDPDYWHYAAAKAGIVAMTKTIARQYGRQDVTAFAIAPGYVDTRSTSISPTRLGSSSPRRTPVSARSPSRGTSPAS